MLIVCKSKNLNGNNLSEMGNRVCVKDTFYGVLVPLNDISEYFILISFGINEYVFQAFYFSPHKTNRL